MMNHGSPRGARTFHYFGEFKPIWDCVEQHIGDSHTGPIQLQRRRILEVQVGILRHYAPSVTREAALSQGELVIGPDVVCSVAPFAIPIGSEELQCLLASSSFCPERN